MISRYTLVELADQASKRGFECVSFDRPDVIHTIRIQGDNDAHSLTQVEFDYFMAELNYQQATKEETEEGTNGDNI